MTDTAYKQGDTVRVTTVGEVMTVEPNYLPIRVADGRSSWIPKSHIESVEVIRSPLTVGDVLPGSEVMAREDWQFGTMLVNVKDPGYKLVRVGDGWISPSGLRFTTLLYTYRILYLPDSA